MDECEPCSIGDWGAQASVVLFFFFFINLGPKFNYVSAVSVVAQVSDRTELSEISLTFKLKFENIQTFWGFHLFK